MTAPPNSAAHPEPLKRRTLSQPSSRRKYSLSLCQDSAGRRFCAVTEIQNPHPDMVLQTNEVPIHLLSAYRWEEVSRDISLVDGGRFGFGPHGEWFTEVEAEALRHGDWASVPWVTKSPPVLPPK
jgi:hypothetical protein